VQRGFLSAIYVVSMACASAESASERSVQPSANASVATAQPPSSETPARAHEDAQSDAIDTAWRDELALIANLYLSWGRVDDEMRFAPGLCRLQMPGRFQMSASTDDSTHGSKLYLLYAKDPVAYGWPRSDRMTAQADWSEPRFLQVIVKESFAAVEKSSDEAHAGRRLDAPAPAVRDGRTFVAGQPLGLYVMFKVDPATAGTDEGWVYGTVSPDGTVTSAGRVGGCMGCHVGAPDDRLFGRKPIKS